MTRLQQRPLGPWCAIPGPAKTGPAAATFTFMGARGAVTMHVRDHPPQTAIPGAPLIRRQGSTIRVTMAPATE